MSYEAVIGLGLVIAVVLLVVIGYYLHEDGVTSEMKGWLEHDAAMVWKIRTRETPSEPYPERHLSGRRANVTPIKGRRRAS